MKNLLELKRFQIKGSRVNQIYPLTEHSGAFRVYIGGRSFDVIASVDEGGAARRGNMSACAAHTATSCLHGRKCARSRICSLSRRRNAFSSTPRKAAM